MNAIMNITNHDIEIKYQNQKFEIYHDEENDKLIIEDVTEYDGKQLIRAYIGEDCEFINDKLVFHEEMLYYYTGKYEDWCIAESKLNYNLPFKYETIYIYFNKWSRLTLFDNVVDPSICLVDLNDGSMFCEDRNLINIIKELTENEKQRLIEILKPYNFKWLQQAYLERNFDREYKLIFEPDS